MLKYTDVELDLITDTDMYQMMEKGILGGISNISHRYATSNNPNIDTYHEKEEIRTLTYQEANALYSWAMSQLLPTKDFKWVLSDEVDILNVPRDNRINIISIHSHQSMYKLLIICFRRFNEHTSHQFGVPYRSWFLIFKIKKAIAPQNMCIPMNAKNVPGLAVAIICGVYECVVNLNR